MGFRVQGGVQSRTGMAYDISSIGGQAAGKLGSPVQEGVQSRTGMDVTEGPAAVRLDEPEQSELQPMETRSILADGLWIEHAPIYSWPEIRIGHRIEGPAIVHQELATILVPQNYRAQLSAFGDLEMTKA